MGVLGSLPATATIVRGSIGFAGRDLVKATRRRVAAHSMARTRLCAARGDERPQSRSRIGRQFADLVGDHPGEQLKGEWLERVEEALAAVRLEPDVLGSIRTS